MLNWPYRSAEALGYWGLPTSTENFCEEDYNISHYVAEFINTLTSLGYVLYAWHGVRMVRSGQLPEASWMPYLALAGVGVFSAMFHATLWVETQRCDGLSMLVATAAVLHRVATFKKPTDWNRRFTIFLLAWMSFASLLYILRDILIVHQASFGIMCFWVAFKTRQLMTERVTDPLIRKQLRKLARSGSICGLTGFLIWLTDNFACSQLRSVRHTVGVPWGFFFEFHGWWHFLTGIAAYIYMTLVEVILTDPQLKTSSKYRNIFAWPIFLAPGFAKRQGNGHVPSIRPQRSTS